MKMPDFKELNEIQFKAVTHGKGHLLLLAGPGSGKTHVITHRILYLLNVLHVPPENILVLTYTKAAALSMRERFNQLSTVEYPILFGTFHSVFLEFLTKSQFLTGYKFMNKQDKRSLLKEALFACGINGISMSSGEEEKTFEVLSFYKNTGQFRVDKLPDKIKSNAHVMLKCYEEKRRSRRLLDFDDILTECMEAFKSNSLFRKKWQGNYSHILIDEFQDINPIQYNILKFLTSDTTSLFAVGDDDQSIYGFRGASPLCMKNFIEDFEVKCLQLKINYRSCKGIVDITQKMIEENANRFKKVYRSFDENSSGALHAVTFHEFKEREMMYEYLCDKLTSISSGESYAIIFRTNSKMQSFAHKLMQKHIPFQIREKPQNLYEHEIAKDIFTYFKIAYGSFTREDIFRIMNKPFRYINREEIKEGKLNLISYDNIFKMGYQQDFKAGYNTQRFYQQLKYLGTLNLSVGLRFIVKAMGYEKYVKARTAEYDMFAEEFSDIYEFLQTEAVQYESFKKWYEDSINNEYFYQSYIASKDASLYLLTAHSSKGLEFDHVIIPECNEKVFPQGNITEPEALEEERRVLYVAMTRAKKSLEVLYTLYIQERPRLVSRFLNSINQKQFRQIHNYPETHQICQQPSHIHRHPQ